MSPRLTSPSWSASRTWAARAWPRGSAPMRTSSRPRAKHAGEILAERADAASAELAAARASTVPATITRTTLDEVWDELTIAQRRELMAAALAPVLVTSTRCQSGASWSRSARTASAPAAAFARVTSGHVELLAPDPAELA